jgi:transcriptional regulator with XRE-family HTH domain
VSLLKELLREKGLKQKWLADKLGVSEVTLSHWVKGKSFPNSEHVERICEILNVPTERLMHK